MEGLEELTPRRAVFVAEYMKDYDATAAAIRAGYSATTAQEQSSQLLSNLMVRKAVADRIVATAKAAAYSHFRDSRTLSPRDRRSPRHRRPSLIVGIAMAFSTAICGRLLNMKRL